MTRDEYEFAQGWDREEPEYPALLEPEPDFDREHEHELIPDRLEVNLPIDPDDEWTDAAITGLAGQPFRFHGTTGHVVAARRGAMGVLLTVEVFATPAILGAFSSGSVEGFSIGHQA